MRSSKSVHAVFAASAAVWLTVAACKATGTFDDPGASVEDPAPDAATVDDASIADVVGARDAAWDARDAAAVNYEADAAPLDASATDPQDAQVVDAGDEAAPQGAACPSLNEIQQQPCGACGHQTRTCLVSDAGGGAWGPWGFCQGEVAGGCVPGSSVSEPCGMCGMRTRTCQANCAYATGTCQGEPANACDPGSVDFEVGLSCDAGGRLRTCSDGGAGSDGVAACTWGNFGDCFVPDGGSIGGGITISTTPGGEAKNPYDLADDTAIARLSIFSNCPNASVTTDPTQVTSYRYVEVHNPSGATARVSIWTSPVPGKPELDTIMAAYTGSSIPATTADREACAVGVDDGCSDPKGDPTACASGWAGLIAAPGAGDMGVTIAPYASVLVYVAAYYGASSSHAHSGSFTLTVRTESLN